MQHHGIYSDTPFSHLKKDFYKYILNRKETIAAFYSLIQAGLWEKECRLKTFEAVDFNEIYKLAQEQSVVGLVTAGLEHVTDVELPKDVVLQFIGDTMLLEHRNKAMNNFIGVITEKTREAGIYTLLVKGQGIAQCYERPSWRASGDVDLLLDQNNYEKAKAFLTPFASPKGKEITEELHLGLTIDQWEVELHGTLHSELSFRIDRKLDEIQRIVFSEGLVRKWHNGETDICLPRPDEDVIFVFTHILQHFYKGGIGLRQICDWCRLLWTYKDSIDRSLLENRLKRMGLMSEWKAFGSFALFYLGMPADAIPFYSSLEKWGRKAKRICSFVMEVGNMGHNRDSDYYSKYPFIIRKAISYGRRIGDILRHARLFPIDTIRFFFGITLTGLRSALKGL